MSSRRLMHCRWIPNLSGVFAKRKKKDEGEPEKQKKKWILQDVSCECQNGEVLAMQVKRYNIGIKV